MTNTALSEINLGRRLISFCYYCTSDYRFRSQVRMCGYGSALQVQQSSSTLRILLQLSQNRVQNHAYNR